MAMSLRDGEFAKERRKESEIPAHVTCPCGDPGALGVSGFVGSLAPFVWSLIYDVLDRPE